MKIKNNRPHALKWCVALMITALPVLAVQAADIGLANASFDNLRYRLIDLAPEDGITPWVTLSPFSASAQSSTGFPSPIAPISRSGSGSLLDLASPLSLDTGRGSTVTLQGNRLSVQATIDTVNLAQVTHTEVTQSAAYTVPQSDGTVVVVPSSVDTKTTSELHNSASVLLSRSKVTLSPHTLLVVETDASVSATFNSTIVSDQLNSARLAAEALSPNNRVQISPLFGKSTASVQLILGTPLPVRSRVDSPQTSSGGLDVTVDGYPNGTDWGSASDAQAKPMLLTLTNLTDQSLVGEFTIEIDASVDQAAYSILREFSGPLPSVIPEPSTTALMGLGLVGLMGTLRRKSARRAIGASALACSAGLLASPAAQAQSLGSAQMDMTGLRFRVIDLTPDDGVAASFSIGDVPLEAQTHDRRGASILTLPSPGPQPGSSVQGSLLDSTTSVSVPLPASGTLATLGQNQIHLSATMDKASVLASTTTQQVATADPSLAKLTSATNAQTQALSLGNSTNLQVGANTLLVIEGDVTLQTSFDMAAIDQVADAFYGSTGSLSSNARSFNTSYAGLTVGLSPLTTEEGLEVGYGSYRENSSTVRRAVNGSTQQSFVVSFANPSDQTVGASFNVVGWAQVTVALALQKTVSLAPSLPPVDTIPEPASYALMGLGLVGLSLVARRQRPLNT
jgi:hypothetical protein